MGNVVVSEALRQSAVSLMNSYVASQSAEISGSYDASLPTMVHELVVDSNPFSGTFLDADGAWRWYNAENTESDYGMPPDIYRYNNMIVQENGASVLRHGVTTSAQLAQEFGPAPATDPDVVPEMHHYYEGIKNKGARITNFANPRDAALNAWEFNQLTKPDFLDDPVWRYSNEQLCREDVVLGDLLWYYPDNSSCEGPSVTEVTSRFYSDNDEIEWNSVSQEGFHGYAQIMGHVIPARTIALGQVEVGNREISTPRVNEGFSSSNQGHSAQFHGYLGDTEVSTRDDYWLDVMRNGFGMNPLEEGVYSKLRPSEN
jgi:hypothetical protein